MNLLLKLLRPERVPSPNRKKIPFGTRLQLFLYRSGLKRLKKKYCRCAYSDTMIIVGNPSIKVYHEFRDISFETELKRLNIPFTEGMIECTGATSHHPEKHKRQPSYNQFHFEDSFLLDIDNQKISIKHGDGHSFVSTINGSLKESNDTSIMSKYIFSGSRRTEKGQRSKINASISSAYSEFNPYDNSDQHGVGIDNSKKGGQDLKKKTGPLFGDDPLLHGVKPDINNDPKPATPATKILEGVIIDESF